MNELEENLKQTANILTEGCGLLLQTIERLKLENEQWVLNFLDELNKYSVKY